MTNILFKQTYKKLFFTKNIYTFLLLFILTFFINTNISKADTVVVILPNDATLSSYYCDVGIFSNGKQTGCDSLYFTYSFYNISSQLDSYSENCKANWNK